MIIIAALQTKEIGISQFGSKLAPSIFLLAILEAATSGVL